MKHAAWQTLKDYLKVQSDAKVRNEKKCFSASGTYKIAFEIDIALKGEKVMPFTAAAFESELEDGTVIPYFLILFCIHN